MLLIILTFASIIVDTVFAHIEIADNNRVFEDLPALFGPEISQVGLTGYLIPMKHLVDLGLAKDVKGCEPVPLPAEQTTLRIAELLGLEISNGEKNDIPWIALVERGDCSFERKVLAMQFSGAIGVIVGDNVVEPLIRMSGGELRDKISIPSTFVSHWDAFKLQSLALDESNKKLTKLVIRVVSDNITLTPIIFLFAVMMFIILAGVWKARFDNSNNAASRLANFPSFFHEDPAPERIVNAIPTKIFYKSKLAENDPDICAICLDDFEDCEELRKLPCKHEFHVHCVDPWLLLRKKLCPICKMDICPNISMQLSEILAAANAYRLVQDNSNSNGSEDPERQPLLATAINALENPGNHLERSVDSPNSGIFARTASPIGSSTSQTSSTVINLRRTPLSDASIQTHNLFNVIVADENDYEEARQLAMNSNRS